MAKKQGVLYWRVKTAVESYIKTRNLRQFAINMANAGDVRYESHKRIVLDAIRELVPKKTIDVSFSQESISIKDSLGEIVYWHIDEWKENPQIVFSIANAVKLAIEGINLREKLKKGRTVRR